MDSTETYTRLCAQGSKEIRDDVEKLEAIRKQLTEISLEIIDRSIPGGQYKEEFVDVTCGLRLSKRCLDKIIIQRKRDLIISAKKPNVYPLRGGITE